MQKPPPNNRDALTPRVFLLRWGVISLGVLAASQIVPGIGYSSPAGLVIAALLLGFLNAFLRPILLLVSLPLVVLTFGLFLWIINASLLYFVGSIVKSFHVDSFTSALGGAAVISMVSLIGGSILGINRRPTLKVRASATLSRPTQSRSSSTGPIPDSSPGPRSGPASGSGSGPVIDV